jgi:hypothetical protein
MATAGPSDGPPDIEPLLGHVLMNSTYLVNKLETAISPSSFWHEHPGDDDCLKPRERLRSDPEHGGTHPRPSPVSHDAIGTRIHGYAADRQSW